MTDQRPDPKPRKHITLWQLYLQLDELEEMRKRHNLRISSIEHGKSHMDAQLEQDFIDILNLDKAIDITKKSLILMGQETGCIWEWITSIKGLASGKMAAQLLAQIDDIEKFSTVSKLWRFAGWAVIDGKAERNQMGEKSHFNRKLKSICWLIGEQFIRQQTPGYAEIYYDEKARLRQKYPEKIKVNGKWKYNDGHLHNMAKRKMIKIFLQHVWVKWRECEGLPVSNPYVQDILGHTNIIGPDDV